MMLSDVCLSVRRVHRD